MKKQKIHYLWTKKLGATHYAGKNTTLCGKPMLGNNYSKVRPNAPLCDECLKIATEKEFKNETLPNS